MPPKFEYLAFLSWADALRSFLDPTGQHRVPILIIDGVCRKFGQNFEPFALNDNWNWHGV